MRKIKVDRHRRCSVSAWDEPRYFLPLPRTGYWGRINEGLYPSAKEAEPPNRHSQAPPGNEGNEGKSEPRSEGNPSVVSPSPHAGRGVGGWG
jgi:hypothetical protein